MEVRKHSSYFSYLCSSPVKPKTPTIVSVKESNGNFHVKWKQNVKKSLRDNLSANVTYHKKGDAKKVRAMQNALYNNKR